MGRQTILVFRQTCLESGTVTASQWQLLFAECAENDLLEIFTPSENAVPDAQWKDSQICLSANVLSRKRLQKVSLKSSSEALLLPQSLQL